VGQRRTGVIDTADLVKLAGAVAATPKFAFAGIQGYAAHAQHIAHPADRRVATTEAAEKLRGFADALGRAGLHPALITGSGTGTYRQDCEGPYNELQVGSYVFMDSDYGRIIDEGGAAPPFEPSLFVLGTIVSVNRPGEVTVD